MWSMIDTGFFFTIEPYEPVMAIGDTLVPIVADTSVGLGWFKYEIYWFGGYRIIALMVYAFALLQQRLRH